jgi:hypothetical protein
MSIEGYHFFAQPLSINPINLEKSADVVRKSIFRYLSVPFAYGSMNIFIQKTFEDISIKSSS